MREIKQLYDTYNFPGFRVERKVAGVFGDPYTVVLRLRRRGKKRFAGLADVFTGRSTIARCVGYGIFPAGIGVFVWMWRFVEFGAEGVGR
jgi:hypothetical protein